MGDSSLNGMVREEMNHEDDEKHHRQHHDHEEHQFKNGMEEHHSNDGAVEDGGEYETAHQGEQEHDDFG
ncbi:unnamed protein product [Onchocerca flexuosa]|uniref:Zinc transporter permease n=1 Tax=Onchocerca flexuosa TaxID=387005 RepID=A0A183HWH1_9BILA|nr:unnamed protein product [Onchocerca flexuosa]